MQKEESEGALNSYCMMKYLLVGHGMLLVFRTKCVLNKRISIVTMA